MDSVCYPKGFWAQGVSCGLKSSGPDLGLLRSHPPARVFAAFTKNSFAAAPVKYCREALQKKEFFTHILVNSGNANACTGEQGEKDVQKTADLIKECFSGVEGVLIASTGVIGVPLPMEKIKAGIARQLVAENESNEDAFSRAILTTDTRSKKTQKKCVLSVGEVCIGGSAKGSGMIRPNMATMLAFITTDIGLPVSFKRSFPIMIEKSFNSISVDGDMSTNDSVFLMANGSSGLHYQNLSPQDQKLFEEALQEVCLDLAKLIVADGEGATKLIEVQIQGAENETEAREVARAISNSPLVKTAMFGKDPNWGRIVAAIGSLEKALDTSKVSISLGGVKLFYLGTPQKINPTEIKQVLENNQLVLEVQLGRGFADWVYWTCDFSYEYVRINAEYHT